MRPLPGDRPPQTLLERRPAAPTRSAPRSLEKSTHWRSISPDGVPPPRMSGSHARAGEPADQLDHVEHPVRLAAAGVERLAESFAPPERGRDRQVRRDRILDVEEVALRRAVGADHRRAAGERGRHRLGHQPRGVGVAAAVQVREPRDRDRELPRVPVGAGEQVGRRPSRRRRGRSAPAGSARDTGARPMDRRPCPRRRRSPARRRGAGRPRAAASVPRMFVSNVETWGAVGGGDDRLRGEVEHVLDLVLGQRPLDQAGRRRCRHGRR